MLEWDQRGMAYWPSFPKDILERLREPTYASFKKLIDCYCDLSFLFVNILLTGPAFLHQQGPMTMLRAIPIHLQAEYSLLHLQTEASLAEVRTKYRELAKRYHPDVGGQHTDFLALRQAYERVVEYQQTRR